MRRAAAGRSARQQLHARTGLQDPELVKELEALGFTLTRSTCFRSCRSFRWRGPRAGSATPSENS